MKSAVAQKKARARRPAESRLYDGRRGDAEQLSLPLPRRRGGWRPNAGRKPAAGPRRVAHRTRPAHAAGNPVHITLSSGLRCLRTRFVFPTIRGAIAATRNRRPNDFRVVHFSVQATHLHLLVEASSAAELTSGIRSLIISIARRLNRLLMRRGRIWTDRWHGRALTSPRAVRHCLVYVLGNFRKHDPNQKGRLDPYSSAPHFTGFREFPGRQPIGVLANVLPRALAPPGECLAPTAPPRTWLLGHGWQRHGLIAMNERPASPRPSAGACTR
jgi:hypothetical protein